MFESNDRKKLLQKQIEKKIEGEYGFSVIIVLRTTVELGKIIGNCPFLEKSVFKAADSAVGESLYVVLFEWDRDIFNSINLMPFEAYIFCAKGVNKSPIMKILKKTPKNFLGTFARYGNNIIVYKSHYELNLNLFLTIKRPLVAIIFSS